jgi:hypothetical protein
MNEQRYKILKAGDERREGDEVRHVDKSKSRLPCIGLLACNRLGYECRIVLDKPHSVTPGMWEPVQLLGHPILISDLLIAEFRRPLPF